VKKFKFSVMMLFAAMLVFYVHGSGNDNPENSVKSIEPDDSNYAIEIRPGNATLYINCEYKIYAIKKNCPKHLNEINWKVDDASIACIDANGKLRPLKSGKLIVTGTTEKGEIGIAEYTVSPIAAKNVFKAFNGVLIEYNGKDVRIVIPESINGMVIKSIGRNYGYFYNKYVESIEISSVVTNISDAVFAYCFSLSSIKVDSSNVKYKDIDGMLYDKISNELLFVPKKRISNGTYNIPTGVTSIGKNAFLACINLKSIEIPSGVTRIKEGAFIDCKTLKSIKIPVGVTSIEGGTFSGCINLRSIEIPSSLTNIDYYAFFGCSSLKKIEIPSGVKNIGKFAFYRCSSLESIEIPSSVTNIDNCAFSGCSSLKSIKVPLGVTSIDHNTFSGCSSLERIEIPEGVTSIGDLALSDCSSLESIEIPSSVTSIEYGAFSGCISLKSIEIPSRVMNIGDAVFIHCSSLSSIKVDSSNAKYKDIDGALYDNTSNKLLCVPNKKIINGSYNIPSVVTNIGNRAFCACVNLESIKIPSGVISIGNYAFWECISLKSIEIPSGMNNIGDCAFLSCSSLETVRVKAVKPPTLGSAPFDNCFKLMKIEVPTASLAKYKDSEGWKEYASIIVGF